MAQTFFAVCIENKGYEVSLEKGKLYRIIPDEQAAAHGYYRVIDESGEDYAFSSERFVPLAVPRKLEKILLLAGTKTAPSGTRRVGRNRPRPARSLR